MQLRITDTVRIISLEEFDRFGQEPDGPPNQFDILNVVILKTDVIHQTRAVEFNTWSIVIRTSEQPFYQFLNLRTHCRLHVSGV